MHVKFEGQTYETMTGVRMNADGHEYITLNDGGNPRRVRYDLVTRVPAPTLVDDEVIEDASDDTDDEDSDESVGPPKVSGAVGYHIEGLPHIPGHKHYIKEDGTCRCEGED